MIIRKSHAAALALAVAATALMSPPASAQTGKPARAPQAQSQSPFAVQRGQPHDDLWRYGNRDGATVWLPGTTSPRVSGH
ncbi:MAG: hypothetical protein HXY30_20245 [Pseudorhodoplanes sp.]|nr:hypothetical protein [Pseudorhodoplanes sp.]